MASTAPEKGFKPKFKQKWSTYDRNHTRKMQNRLFLQNRFAFTLSTLVKYVMVL